MFCLCLSCQSGFPNHTIFVLKILLQIFWQTADNSHPFWAIYLRLYSESVSVCICLCLSVCLSVCLSIYLFLFVWDSPVSQSVSLSTIKSRTSLKTIERIIFWLRITSSPTLFETVPDAIIREQSKIAHNKQYSNPANVFCSHCD